jgi:hypothetical protein
MPDDLDDFDDIEIPDLDDVQFPDLEDVQFPDLGESMDAKPEEDSDFEEESEKIVSKLENEFTRAAKKETKRFQDNVDTEFWAAIYFQSREQKDAFLKAIGANLDKEDKYVDGCRLAKVMGIEIPPSPKRSARRGISQDFIDLSD